MAKIPTRKQVSAGGVVFRQTAGKTEVALISVLIADRRSAVGEEARWQLPKGLIGRGETPEETALREVREETGLDSIMIAPLDTIEYWYYSTTKKGKRLRYHKFVHYYLLRYTSGSTVDHDAEVNEARWFEINEAIAQLAFENERDVVHQAQATIDTLQ